MNFVVCWFRSKKLMFTQTSFRDSISVSDSFNPGLTRRFVWPDRGPNVCNAEDSSRQRVKAATN